MLKYNLSRGWTAGSIAAPAITAAQSAAPPAQQYSQTSRSPAVADTPPATQSADPLSLLRNAALGQTGLGGSISASTYQHADAPAFLTQAVNNLNGSQGFAQQNLTNLLLQQILMGQHNTGGVMTQDLHDAQANAVAAADKHKVAAAQAEKAANEAAMEARLTRLRSNATITPYSGWTNPAVPF